MAMAEEKEIALRLFGSYADRLYPRLTSLEEQLPKAGIRALPRSYISLMMLYSIVAFLASFFSSIIALSFIWGPIIALALSVPLSVFFLAGTFVASYYYPSALAGSRARKIEAALPFAINHMAAVSSSGVPPYMVFKTLAAFEEYGEISREAKKIVSSVEMLGLDVAKACKQLMGVTPSAQFKELLQGFVSTLETGGDLKGYMEVQSREALFRYRLMRERFMDTLATYADFYTAVLIVAPLFLISLLAVMGAIGGSISGLPVSVLLSLGIYLLIPLANVLFVTFIHLTQPEQVGA